MEAPHGAMHPTTLIAAVVGKSEEVWRRCGAQSGEQILDPLGSRHGRVRSGALEIHVRPPVSVNRVASSNDFSRKASMSRNPDTA